MRPDRLTASFSKGFSSALYSSYFRPYRPDSVCVCVWLVWDSFIGMEIPSPNPSAGLESRWLAAGPGWVSLTDSRSRINHLSRLSFLTAVGPEQCGQTCCISDTVSRHVRGPQTPASNSLVTTGRFRLSGPWCIDATASAWCSHASPRARKTRAHLRSSTLSQLIDTRVISHATLATTNWFFRFASQLRYWSWWIKECMNCSKDFSYSRGNWFWLNVNKHVMSCGSGQWIFNKGRHLFLNYNKVLQVS